MKNLYYSLICILIVQLFSVKTSTAQTAASDPSVLKVPPSAITIDADLKDWGDSLQYYNADNNVRYTISNDKENLYFAVRIDDRVEAARILKAGLTLGVDPKGKKKSSFSITFPLNVQVGNITSTTQQENFNEVTQAERDELVRETATTLRGIKVEGFKDIEGDMITTSNTYGIKTAINYDAKGNLVCEAAVALKLFHVDEHAKTEWTFDVKINGVNRPGELTSSTNASGMGGGRGGMGGGGMGGGRGGMGGGRGGKGGSGSKQATATPGSDSGLLSKSVDFAGKFYLSNAQ
jgi:YD repeat-containing protein